MKKIGSVAHLNIKTLITEFLQQDDTTYLWVNKPFEGSSELLRNLFWSLSVWSQWKQFKLSKVYKGMQAGLLMHSTQWGLDF